MLITPFKQAEEIYEQAEQMGFRQIVVGKDLNVFPKTLLPWTMPTVGHYYSLYPDLDYVEHNYEQVRDNSKSGFNTDGIDMNDEYQLGLQAQMNELFPSFPKWSKSGNRPATQYRYCTPNPTFCPYDAYLLHFMLRIFKPARLTEIGCGFSSAVTLDTNEFYLDGSMELKFVEPNPERFYSIMKPADKERVTLKTKTLQEIPLDFFDDLEANDILFIDSTHVIKFGSDVDYAFFHIFPRLKSGVIVHLHDIFYPWQYPKRWHFQGMAWNELFLLRGFLSCNKEWKVLYAADYMEEVHRDKYCEEWRQQNSFGGGSFYMQKL